MDKTELAMLYFLHSIKGVGNRTLWKIKDIFGSFQNCFAADRKQLYASALPIAVTENIIAARKDVNPLALLEELLNNNIGIACIENTNYPSLLANIFDPPYIFYYYGELTILDNFCMAIVGSRGATAYGKTQARRFGGDLARAGMAVVSGMARGIDSEAHRGALDTGGKTAAVLGCGLNIIYPPENRNLYNDICTNGLVISEFPLHTAPEAGNFPARNRTISGLSRGVLVVEAQKKSGALITADFALEQGRDVFAIPGPISSKNSEGTNSLIKQGARLVSGVEDILEEYGMNESPKVLKNIQQGNLFSLDEEERMVLECMSYEPLHFDELLNKTTISIGQLSTVLLKMELKGIIKGMPGNYYVKI